MPGSKGGCGDPRSAAIPVAKREGMLAWTGALDAETEVVGRWSLS